MNSKINFESQTKYSCPIFDSMNDVKLKELFLSYICINGLYLMFEDMPENITEDIRGIYDD